MAATRNTTPVAITATRWNTHSGHGSSPSPYCRYSAQRHQRRRRRGSPGRYAGAARAAAAGARATRRRSTITRDAIQRSARATGRCRASVTRMSWPTQHERDDDARQRPRNGGVAIHGWRHVCDFASAWSMSQRISSSVSSPTDSLIISGDTPAARCSSSRQLAVRRRRRMDDQRLRVADVGEMRQELHALDELDAGRGAAAHAEREDAAGAARQVAPREVAVTALRQAADS